MGTGAGSDFTILVVDDESIVLRLIQSTLSLYKLNALYATNGDEALAISRQHQGTIELLITDMIMPGMDGLELCRKIGSERPETAFLLMSGLQSTINTDIPVLDKPFSHREFLRKISAVMQHPITELAAAAAG
jgi:two-component system, cell cycle sensor histidine kinase and response regulator CckA